MTPNLVSRRPWLARAASPEASRLFALDLLKAIGIGAVVSFHSLVVPQAGDPASLGALETLFAPLRFCVPLLFTISFLLLRRSLQRAKDRRSFLKKRLIRLGIPTLCWFAVAALLRQLGGAPVWEPLLRGYIFPGAYYLVVLLVALPVVVWQARPISTRLVLGITLFQGLLFVGLKALLANPDGQMLVQILALPGRSLPLYWVAYMAMGCYLGDRYEALTRLSRRLPLGVKLGMMGGLWGLMGLEYAHLQQLTEGSVAPFEYAMVSCLLSVPVWLLCLAALTPADLGAGAHRVMGLLSRYSLGIFCLNGLLSLLLLALMPRWMPEVVFSLLPLIVIKGISWIGLLGLSLGLSLILDRCHLGRCVR